MKKTIGKIQAVSHKAWGNGIKLEEQGWFNFASDVGDESAFERGDEVQIEYEESALGRFEIKTIKVLAKARQEDKVFDKNYNTDRAAAINKSVALKCACEALHGKENVKPEDILMYARIFEEWLNK